jgi:hypothetical protein
MVSKPLFLRFGASARHSAIDARKGPARLLTVETASTDLTRGELAIRSQITNEVIESEPRS